MWWRPWRRRERVGVRALVGGDEDGHVVGAALHLLPHRARRRHRAPVVGPRARVPLGDLLPVLPPLAPVVHRGGVAFDADGNPSLLGLLLEHIVVGSSSSIPGARALPRLGRRRRWARGGRGLNGIGVGVRAAAAGAEVEQGGLLVIVVVGPAAAEPEGEPVVAVGVGSGRRGRRPLVAGGGLDPPRAGVGSAPAEAEGDEVLGGGGSGNRRGGELEEVAYGGGLGLGLRGFGLDGGEEVRVERLVIADDLGEQRLEPLVLLAHGTHLRLGRLQLSIIPFLLLLVGDRVSLRSRCWETLEDYRRRAPSLQAKSINI